MSTAVAVTTARMTVVGTSPLIFSRRVEWPKVSGADAHTAQERELWRDKAHTTKDGNVYIPGISFQRALVRTASQLGRKLQGQQKFGKAFEVGIQYVDHMYLGVKVDDLVPEEIWCSSTGKKGGAGGTQVLRVFPCLPEWGGTIEFLILNAQITEPEFRIHAEQSGLINGVLSFRPQNGGWNGRYRIQEVVWMEADSDE